MKKRLMSMLLCLCMVVGMLPAMMVTAQAAGTGVADRLNQLRNSYPDWQYWYRVNGVNQVTSTPCPHYNDLSTCGWYNSGWQCWAFASKIFCEVFGQNPNVYGDQRRDKENIRVGDYVRFSWPNDKRYGHSFVVLSISGSIVTAVECNTEEGNCRIRWDRGKYDLNSGMKAYDPYGRLTNYYFDYYCRATNYDEINGSSSAPSQNIGNDFYAYIKGEVGNVYLTNQGSNAQTARASTYDPRQIWHFIWDGSRNSYKIANMHDGRCLNVDRGNYSSGADVRIYDDNGDVAERWRLQSVGGSVYKFMPYASDLCLDVSGGYSTPGTNIQLYAGNNSTAQKFEIIKIGNIGDRLTSLTTSANGSNFYARIGFKNMYVQTTGTYNYNNLGEGNMDVKIARSNAADPRQIWHFERQSDGSYKIRNEYNGWYLDVQGGWTSNGTNVWTWYDSHSGDSERWYPIYSPTDGTYRLASKLLYPWTVNGCHTLRSMDIYCGLTDSGTNVQLYVQHDGDAQQFSIDLDYSYTKPSAPSAPTNIYTGGPPESVSISWSSVPEKGTYDSREYQIILRDSNGSVIKSWRQTGTSYTYQNLPVGRYSVSVRAINTKYPSSSSNYGSAYNTRSFNVISPIRISLIASPAEGGRVDGTGIYAPGESALMQAIPNTGYHFVKWTQNGTEYNQNAEFWLAMTSDLNLMAIFEKDAPKPAEHRVSVSADPSSGGTVSGGGTYAAGAPVTVTAKANEGYAFVCWIENGNAVSSESSYTFTASSDRTLTAIFEAIPDEPEPEPQKYTISVTASPVAGGTVTGGGSYTDGTGIIVMAVPNSGYRFKGWLENGNMISDANASYTFSASEARALTAVFEKIETYTVSVRATTGGKVSGGGTYEKGQTATLTAMPANGYRFLYWTENSSEVSKNTSYSFSVNENRTLTAVFEQENISKPALTYTVEVEASPAEGGTVTGSGYYDEGASVSVTAAPKSGYQFVGWLESGDTVSTNTTYQFNINGNRALTAMFKADTPISKPTYTISVSANPAEYGSIVGGGSYQEGDLVTISAMPNSGYQFIEWRVNGQKISSTASYTFTAHTDQTFTAIFEKAKGPQTPPTLSSYTITTSADPMAGGRVSGGGTFAENSTITVTATANNNYRFTGWFENGTQVSTNASYTFTIGVDRALVAGFTYIGGSTSTPSNNPGSTSTGQSSLPVSTNGTGNSMTTTASPNATIKGDTATSVITSTIAQEIIKQTVANDSGEVVIAPVIKTGVTKAEITLPATVLSEIGQKTDAGLVISTPHADVSFQNSGLSTLSNRQDVVVSTERTGNALEFSITVGGQPVERVPGGLTLTTPVDHSVPGTVAVMIHGDGSREVIRKSMADRNTITITLDGSAKLEIIDNAKTFADVSADNWAADAIAFASGHELFSGTGSDRFSPDLPMTRGMLAMVLHNLENNPAQPVAGMFSDVTSDAWYSEAVAWAAVRGIVSGYGNGLFGPGDNITREQLVVMLWRYAGEPAATTKELHFNDVDEVSGYALDALCWATENGIINGKGGGILDPRGQATRAQVAQVLMNYLKK